MSSMLAATCVASSSARCMRAIRAPARSRTRSMRCSPSRVRPEPSRCRWRDIRRKRSSPDRCNTARMSEDRTADEARWSAWMLDAQRGDRDSYARLLTELVAVVRAFLTKRFGSVDFVDDCVQESLIAVHEARHTYDAGRPFRAWLFAIVRYKAIDMLRHRESYSRALERAQDAASNETTESPRDAGDVIAALEPKLREALVLTKLLGLSMREAAVRTGVSEGAMK